MKRIIIVAIVAAFAQAAGGFPPQRPQPREAPTKLRRIPVNARTITALPRGKHYVADLTKPGMVYEFDVNTSQIDFSRVMVRTAEGEVPIASFLESAFPKDALPGFKLLSQSFRLVAPSGQTVQISRVPSNFKCGAGMCTCKGIGDCVDLIFSAGVCGGAIYCGKDSKGVNFCFCARS